MTDQISRYPLQWPTGWKRTPAGWRDHGRFNRKESRQHQRGDGTSWTSTSSRQLSVSDAIARVLGELEKMGIADHDIVISTNVSLRLDGLPRSGQSEPEDSGAAVYWIDAAEPQKPPKCMAIDRYHRVADNLAALAATLEAMRAIDRHGGAEILDRAFAGFLALPPPMDWREVLGFARGTKPTLATVEDAYRKLASKLHPDKGGFADDMVDLNIAREAAREELGQA